MKACVCFSLCAVSAYFNTQEQLNVQVSIVALVCMLVVIGGCCDRGFPLRYVYYTPLGVYYAPLGVLL